MFPSIPRDIMVKIGWAGASHAVVMLLKMVNNIILTRLLAPPLFGIMVIVNTIRTGVELLSDLGIGQSLITNKKGDTPDYLNTGWTLAIIRATFLGAACFLLSETIAGWFGKPELATVLPVVALFFLFQGYDSIARVVLQKRMAVTRLAKFEMAVALLSVIIHVVLALISPTIWALVLGSVLTGAVALVSSFLLIPGMRHRLMLNRTALWEIINLGKWFFVSSVIYFVAMNFDRLYFAKQLTLSQLGIYGIARTLADLGTGVVGRVTGYIIFPIVAKMEGSNFEIRGRLLKPRRMLLLAASLGMGVLVATSDLVVHIMFDPRYYGAAVILPLLLLGVWFTVLGQVNDSIAVGLGRPGLAAGANFVKLITVVVIVPLAFIYSGFVAAVIALAFAEAAKYLALWLLSRRQQIGFVRQDASVTMVFLLTILLTREVTFLIGLTEGFTALFPILTGNTGT